MATLKQLQFRLRLAKKTFTRLNKEVTATKNRIKKLETQLNKAKTAEQASRSRKKKPTAKNPIRKATKK